MQEILMKYTDAYAALIIIPYQLINKVIVTFIEKQSELL
jgi:hypothetical protein